MYLDMPGGLPHTAARTHQLSCDFLHSSLTFQPRCWPRSGTVLRRLWRLSEMSIQKTKHEYVIKRVSVTTCLLWGPFGCFVSRHRFKMSGLSWDASVYFLRLILSVKTNLSSWLSKRRGLLWDWTGLGILNRFLDVGDRKRRHNLIIYSTCIYSVTDLSLCAKWMNISVSAV